MYPAEAGFCQADGAPLVELAALPPASDPADPYVGKKLLGRYQVYRTVADGGMGRIYEGFDVRTQSHVALKLLHAEVAADAVSVERFRREFEAGAELRHRHIVAVGDFQPTQDGSYVLAMEYLQGEELRALLKRERVVSPPRLIRILSQLALGMDFAHQRHWVHRDLKPDNIFLCQTPDGDIVKVLDFGSVKDRSNQAKQLTVMGTTIGSPFYMSPEQAQGLSSLDHRSDVWAMAAITYECITGTVPFKGPNGPSTLLQILSGQAEAPSRIAAHYPVPVEVDAAIAAALAKDPDYRTPSVGAFADAMGWGFGLQGQHAQWAEQSEQAIAAQMPRFQWFAPTPTARAASNDSGRTDAALQAAFAATATTRLRPVRRARRPWLLFATLGAAALGALLWWGF